MVIEEPKQGRAKLESWADSLIITIPAKKKLFLIMFLGTWLVGWAFGEFFAFSTLFTGDSPVGVNLFFLFWLIGWSTGGAWAMYAFAWNLWGKEVITVSSSSIKIEKAVLGIRRGKEYLIEDVKNFRIEPSGNSMFDGYRGMEIWGLSGGLIKFDYGMKTIRFVMGVDEAEAIYILEQIQDHIG